MTATAIRNEAIGYINELPEDKLSIVLGYLQNIRAKKNPAEVNTIEEVYQRIDAGLDDLKHGRARPFEEFMDELMTTLQEKADKS